MTIRLSETDKDREPASEELVCLADKLSEITQGTVDPASVHRTDEAAFFLSSKGHEKRLGICSIGPIIEGFHGHCHKIFLSGREHNLLLGQTDTGNAGRLREIFPFLSPSPTCHSLSVGFHDSLDCGTRSYLDFIRKTDLSPTGHPIAPVFGRYSTAKNPFSYHNPQITADRVMWDILQEGWHGGFGLEANRLRTAEDIDRYRRCGYSRFSIDANPFIDGRADHMSHGELRERSESLPWRELDTCMEDVLIRLCDRIVDLGPCRVLLPREEVFRAMVKYGTAIAHAAELSGFLSRTGNRSEPTWEVAVDMGGADSPTSPVEHICIATELIRLGIPFRGLSLRYTGRWEEAVDFQTEEGMGMERARMSFEDFFRQHFIIADSFGSYRLDFRQAGDKLSILPILIHRTGAQIHLSISGLGDLEAIRTVADCAPPVFRRLLRESMERYCELQSEYNVSAHRHRIAEEGHVSDDRLSAMVDHFHTRQILYVGLHSLLEEDPLRRDIGNVLLDNEKHYKRNMQDCLDRYGAVLFPQTDREDFFINLQPCKS